MNASTALRSVVLFILIALLLVACSLDPNVRKQKYIDRGQSYFEKGKYPEAEIEFLNAVKIDQNDADAHYRLAKSYVKLERWPKAYDEFKRTIELQPQNYPARVDLTKLLIASGSLQQAQEQTDLLLQKRPNDAQTHFIFGTLLAAQEKYPAAIGEIEKAIAIDPGDWDSYFNLALLQVKTNQTDPAEVNFKKAIELNPTETSAREMLGNYYQFHGRFAEAETQFRSAIQADSQNPDLRAALARLYIAEGKNADAEEFLKQVKHDFPNNSVGYRMLGDFYFKSGALDKATAEYASLYQEHPKDLTVKKNYIELLIFKDRLDEANSLDQEVLKQAPNDSEGLLYSGEIQIRQGHLADGIATLQRLIKNDPANAGAHDQLAIAFQRSGDQDSAERELREAVRLRPDLSDVQRSLALLAMRKGDMATLEQCATALMNLQPAVPEGYSLRAISEINRKQFAAAEADAHKAIEVGPQSQLGYVQMGNLKFVQKQYRDAASAFQAALDRDANSVDALRGLMNTSIAQNEVDRALAIAETQITKSPSNGDFYDLLGTALFYNKHDLSGAEAALKKSAELNQKNPDALLKLGQVQAAEGQVDEAIATSRQSLQKFPHEVNFLLLLGEFYQSKQDWPNAGDSYQKALVLAPENALASGKLAYVMLQSGQNLDVALSLAQTARRGLPTSAFVADTLGWIYYQKGAYQPAIDSLQEALRLERDGKSAGGPEIHYRLGMAYAKSGQPALARQQLQVVLKTSPNSAEATDARKQLAQLKSAA